MHLRGGSLPPDDEEEEECSLSAPPVEDSDADDAQRVAYVPRARGVPRWAFKNSVGV